MESYYSIFFHIIMFILGAVFGSFLCCQARRLRLTEEGKKKLSKRSVCLNCNHKLSWYENIPIISWIMLGGKCKKCKKEIGRLEIISEIGLGLAFLAISTTISLTTATVFDWSIFLFTLVLTLSLGFLAIYDGKWGELPTIGLTLSIIYAIIIAILKQWSLISVSDFSLKPLTDLALSVLLLGGVYLALYLISKGKWVGNGDWILGSALGIALGSPWLALIVLFLSNLLALLVSLPTLKKIKNKKIYFGPFLVVAYIIVQTFSVFLESVVS